MGIQEELKALSDKIKQYRDEARVQLYLARQDVKNEFNELEHEWDKFRTRFDQVMDDANEASQEARQTAKKVGEELKTSYENIRNKMK